MRWRKVGIALDGHAAEKGGRKTGAGLLVGLSAAYIFHIPDTDALATAGIAQRETDKAVESGAKLVGHAVSLYVEVAGAQHVGHLPAV